MRLSLLLALVLLPAAAAAQGSRAAAWLMQEQIAAACEGGGRIDPPGFIERDLTGDGRDDLVIAHEAITCALGARSSACGMQVCSVLVYVRDGGLLRLEEEMLGGGIAVGAGSPPAITGHGHGGGTWSIRWDGRQFR